MNTRATPPGDPYDFHAIERKWQARWRTDDTHRALRYPEGPTYFILVFPPYPNGKIHMGHVRNYTIGDALARYKRANGFAVLQPIGFDAFGLPNEMEAARHGLNPAAVTVSNIKAMRRQLKRLGYSYDWKSQIITINPRYYRWNQWLFLSLLERDLAYRKEGPVQWCPGCKTSLANEQVIDGRCWRCDQEVLTRYQTQWFFRLRTYAEEIWSEADTGCYPSNIAAMLKEWLRKAAGAELRFPINGGGDTISTFTTKPELSYGARYLALSPEHPLVATLVKDTAGETQLRALRERVRAAADPAELVDGFDTGRTAVHPLTGETIPIWVAAYVDPDFGSGAVMGNPCHDRNDYVFARQHGLPGKLVAHPPGTPDWDFTVEGPYLGDGVLTDSGSFSGLGAAEAREQVISDWEARRIGQRRIVFGIRDWLVSRQRAWGTPIPVIHCPQCGTVGVDRRDLPVRLPKDVRDSGEGNPLEGRPDFLSCHCPRCSGPARRETDTMDTFIDTTWYYLRCANPTYHESLCDPRAVARWGQADIYSGGIEIAVPIMLYGSFVTKALRDAGSVGFSLPCRALLAHDMVLKDGRKMSKSLSNVVDPDELIEDVGADTLRFFILSLAPPLKKIEWSDARLLGCHKFLKRVWSLGLRHAAGVPLREPPTDAEQALIQYTHETIRAVTTDLERWQLNTCLTALIKFLYRLEELENVPSNAGGVIGDRHAFHEAFCALLQLLAPFTPHLCEEIWERIGMSPCLSDTSWPRYDAALLSSVSKSITVKIDGEFVTRIEVPAELTEEQLILLAREDEAVKDRLRGVRVSRQIYVKDQMINLVT